MPLGNVNRRQALASFGVAGGLALAPTTTDAQMQPVQRPPDEKVPVSGKAGPGLEPFDEAMLTIMDRHGIPAPRLPLPGRGNSYSPRATVGPTSLPANRSSPIRCSASPVCRSPSPPSRS